MTSTGKVNSMNSGSHPISLLYSPLSWDLP